MAWTHNMKKIQIMDEVFHEGERELNYFCQNCGREFKETLQYKFRHEISECQDSPVKGQIIEVVYFETNLPRAYSCKGCQQIHELAVPPVIYWDSREPLIDDKTKEVVKSADSNPHYKRANVKKRLEKTLNDISFVCLGTPSEF